METCGRACQQALLVRLPSLPSLPGTSRPHFLMWATPLQAPLASRGPVVCSLSSSSHVSPFQLLGSQVRVFLSDAGRVHQPFCRCEELPFACMSVAAVVGGGGGGRGIGSRGDGGGGDGGEGFRFSATGAQAVGGEPENEGLPAAGAEDVIVLSVGGMSCGGCASSVKRILESQPRVLAATVILAAETAVVKVAPETALSSGWETVKHQLAESLANHLTSCGFKSAVREERAER